MAGDSTIARPYAIAAFRQAQEEEKLGQWSEMLALLGQVTADATMKGIIANPRVDREQLAELVIDVCGDALSGSAKNFVRLLAEYKRLGQLSMVRRIFEQERDKLQGRSQVQVHTAFELDDAQRDAIQTSMAKRLGKEIDLTVEVDESLIGGVMIRAGDTVIDASLRGRLQQLGQTLA